MSLLATTTTINVHLGRPLPAARVVIVVVPLVALTVLWWLTRRSKTK